MKCIDSRMRPDGIRRRRYRHPDGREIVTFEVPATVLRGVTSASRLAEAMAAWHRGEQRRAEAWRIAQQVYQNPNVKPLALAAMLGVTDARIRQIKGAKK